MYTEICKKLGIEIPLFAFSHCRDVVVAVSKAGGIGVLGAVGFSAEQLKEELDWIDEHIGDKPYGVDVVIPQKYEGMGDMDASQLEQQLESMIPEEHRKFAQKLLADHGVPTWPDGSQLMGLLGWTEATATPLLEEALKRPKCKMIANALGTPPADKVKMIQDSGRLVGALCGRVKQVKAHKEAGLDFIIAQGGEGGGHGDGDGGGCYPMAHGEPCLPCGRVPGIDDRAAGALPEGRGLREGRASPRHGRCAPSRRRGSRRPLFLRPSRAALEVHSPAGRPGTLLQRLYHHRRRLCSPVPVAGTDGRSHPSHPSRPARKDPGLGEPRLDPHRTGLRSVDRGFLLSHFHRLATADAEPR